MQLLNLPNSNEWLTCALGNDVSKKAFEVPWADRMNSMAGYPRKLCGNTRIFRKRRWVVGILIMQDAVGNTERIKHTLKGGNIVLTVTVN